MEPVLARLLGVAVLLAVTVALGWWVRSRDGRVTAGDGTRVDATHLDDLGLDLDGAAAGAVLLGSPTCSPCESVKLVLGELEAERSGFRWVYADAADHLGLTQAHRVLRVPTLLVVEPDGRILARTSGVPDRAALRRVLDEGAAFDELVA